jgi:hypothetical protein
MTCVLRKGKYSISAGSRVSERTKGLDGNRVILTAAFRNHVQMFTSIPRKLSGLIPVINTCRA